MDPLSITVSVASLLGACIKIAATLKSFRDASNQVDSKIDGLITEVDRFVQTLYAIEDTLNDSKVQHPTQLTGHIADHWRSINQCIIDGLSTVQSLQTVLKGFDKDDRLFSTVRKHLRFREATEEIAIYQQQIRSYRDTIQLSLQTAIFWNTISAKDASSELLPKLDALVVLIRNLGSDLNRKLSVFEGMIESPERDAQIRNIQNLRFCLKTSHDVVSSASTTLGVSDTGSILALSEYMEMFPGQNQSVVLQWLAEVGNTTQETSQSQAVVSVHVEGDVIADSDSDAELDAEVIQLQLRKGKELVQTGNKVTVERFLAAGISRLKQHRSRYLDSERKLFILDDLLLPLEEQENWTQAKRIRLEKLSVLSSDMITQPDRHLEETLALVEFLLRARHTKEGRIYARKCIKAYRKLGTDGLKGLKQALFLMITACEIDGDEPEEEAYKTMLAHIDMTSNDDNDTVGGSESILPWASNASDASIFKHSVKNETGASSFALEPSNSLDKEAVEKTLHLATPYVTTTRDVMGNGFKTTGMPDIEFTSAFPVNEIVQGIEPNGTTGDITDDLQSIDRNSRVATPSSWQETKGQERGFQSQKGSPYADSRSNLSALIDSNFNQNPDLNTPAVLFSVTSLLDIVGKISAGLIDAIRAWGQCHLILLILSNEVIELRLILNHLLKVYQDPNAKLIVSNEGLSIAMQGHFQILRDDMTKLNELIKLSSARKAHNKSLYWRIRKGK